MIAAYSRPFTGEISVTPELLKQVIATEAKGGTSRLAAEIRVVMSALGHKQTLKQASAMSALPTKADMRLAVQKCPLSATNGHAPWA